MGKIVSWILDQLESEKPIRHPGGDAKWATDSSSEEKSGLEM